MQSLMFLLVFILLFILLPKHSRFKYDFHEGKPWAYNDLVAPFDFPIEKSEAEIQAEEKEIIVSTMPYFYIDRTVKDSVFSRFSTDLGKIVEDKNYSESQQKQLQELGEKYGKIILDSIYAKGILLLKDYPKEMQKEDALIQLMDDKQLEVRSMYNFYNLENLADIVNNYLAELPHYLDKEKIGIVLLRVIEPNIIFDKDKTLAEQKSRIGSISKLKGMVQKNEIIVSKGEIIDAENLQVLRSLKKEFEEGKDSNIFGYGLQVGQALILLVTLLFFHQ
jgi:membrane-associated HD superfamily phosphohydrolase